MTKRVALLLPMLLVLPSAMVHAEAVTIGYVKMLSGTAMVTPSSDGGARHVTLAMAIHAQDCVETGRDGQVGITFSDDTRIALGPNSRVDLVRYIFKPEEKKYGFLLRLAFGTLQYLSGLTAKLAPDAMSIETPGSTIAVRGTRLLIRAAKQP